MKDRTSNLTPHGAVRSKKSGMGINEWLSRLLARTQNVYGASRQLEVGAAFTCQLGVLAYGYFVAITTPREKATSSVQGLSMDTVSSLSDEERAFCVDYPDNLAKMVSVPISLPIIYADEGHHEYGQADALLSATGT